MQAYEKSVVGTNCEPAKQVNALGVANNSLMGKAKRFVSFIIGTIMGIVSVGVMTVEHVFNPSMGATVDQINQQMTEQLNLLKYKGEKMVEYEQKALKALNRTWSKLGELQLEFEDTAKSGRVLMMTLHTTEVMQTHLEQLLEGMVARKIRSPYGHLFPENPFLRGTPLTYWVAHPYEHLKVDKKETVLVLKFEIPIFEKRTVTLEADPFMVVTKREDGVECLRQFNGHKFVVWDKTNNCTRNLFQNKWNGTEWNRKELNGTGFLTWTSPCRSLLLE